MLQLLYLSLQKGLINVMMSALLNQAERGYNYVAPAFVMPLLIKLEWRSYP